MKIEQLNSNAKIRWIDDTMVELGLPEIAPIALYPGQVTKIRTGVKLTLESTEAAVIAFTQKIAESGVTLAHPTLIVDSTDGDLVVSVFNRSSFVQMLDPDKPFCCIITISRGAKIVGQAMRLKAAEAVKAETGQELAKSEGARGTARRLFRKALDKANAS
jgi:dUTPase